MDLNCIYDWVEANNMTFDGEKFHLMTFGTSDHSPKYLHNQRNLIVSDNSIKGLGLIVEDTGEFCEHLQQKVTKAAQILRLLVPMITLFKVIVQPHLDYCSLLWYPKAACQIKKVEQIQRMFTR